MQITHIFWSAKCFQKWILREIRFLFPLLRVRKQHTLFELTSRFPGVVKHGKYPSLVMNFLGNVRGDVLDFGSQFGSGSHRSKAGILPSKIERSSKDSSCFGLPTSKKWIYSRCSSFWNFSFLQLFNFSTLKIKPVHFSTFRSSTFRKYVFNVLFDWNHAPPLSNPGFWRLVLQTQQSHYQDDKDDSKSQWFLWEWKITEHLLKLRMGQIIQHPKNF